MLAASDGDGTASDGARGRPAASTRARQSVPGSAARKKRKKPQGKPKPRRR
jgi:hypothetical protein